MPCPRRNATIKLSLFLLCLTTCGLIVFYNNEEKTFSAYYKNRRQDLDYFKRMLDDKQRPKLWRDVSLFSLFKIFWGTRNTGTDATLSPCTEPARASSGDVTGPLNPLEKLLASEPSGQPKASPQYVAHYNRTWAWINHHTAKKKKTYARFGLKLSPLQKAQLLFTWKVVHEALTLHNLSHFLIGGALIGAMRHGGMIPWDDDIDIGVDGRDLDKLVRVLSCIPGFTLRLDRAYHWKFFHSKATIRDNFLHSPVTHARTLAEAEKRDYAVGWLPDKDVVKRCPYVDLYPVNIDSSHVWCLNQQHTEKYLFPFGDVYPLRYVEFDGLQVPVPRQSLPIINKVYKPYVCTSLKKYHLFDKTAFIKNMDFKHKRYDINCKELAPIYKMNYVHL